MWNGLVLCNIDSFLNLEAAMILGASQFYGNYFYEGRLYL